MGAAKQPQRQRNLIITTSILKDVDFACMQSNFDVFGQ